MTVEHFFIRHLVNDGRSATIRPPRARSCELPGATFKRDLFEERIK